MTKINGTKFKFHALAISSMFTIIFASVFSSADDTVPPDREITISINNVFIPRGIDSHSQAYVVANGIFPNGCYRWKSAKVRNIDSFHHEIEATAMVSQGMCLMVLIPFAKEIDLGVLVSGEHKLKFLSGDGTFLEKTITIQ